MDAYSIKPVDEATLTKAAKETGCIITVEDHSPNGGLGEAVCQAVAGRCPVRVLGVRRVPQSGTPKELMAACNIDARAIAAAVKELVR
jgi:transketolase